MTIRLVIYSLAFFFFYHFILRVYTYFIYYRVKHTLTFKP